jgi:hypothetical protein
MSNREVAQELVKLAPPAGVGGFSLLSIPLNEWVVLLTFVYTGLLILDKVFPSLLPMVRDWVKGWLK